jgi:hypothetical protein
MYVGEDWLEVYPGVAERPQWHRSLIFRPDNGWHIWQSHNFADVAGVEGGCDLNVMR